MFPVLKAFLPVCEAFLALTHLNEMAILWPLTAHISLFRSVSEYVLHYRWQVRKDFVQVR